MTPVLVPHENVNDESVMIVAWRVKSGERIEKDAVMVEVEGSKAAFDIKAPVAGIVKYSLAAGSEVGVGKALCEILEAEGEAAGANGSPMRADVPVIQAKPAAAADNGGLDTAAAGSRKAGAGLRISSKAAALMVENGVDQKSFGGRGLITTRHVLEFLGKVAPEAEAKSEIGLGKRERLSVVGSVAATGVGYKGQALSRAKRTEIKYLGSAQSATLSSQVSVMVPTRGLRGAAAAFPSLQGNFTAVFVFEAARLLRKYPLFNAFYAENEARIYDEVNVGYAVDAGHGLKVLVVRNADTKNLPTILGEMRDQVVRYLNEEQAVLAGGTFTITDLSGEGVCDFVPLLNRGQSAILGVGGEMVNQAGSTEMFKVILAFDHQVTEGKQAAQFLGDLKSRLAGYEAALGPADKTNAGTGQDLHCSECLMTIAEIERMNGQMLQRVKADGSIGLICTKCVGGF
jgi:pyruvate/2-oxoglutarate dehydrogenase complex dihydrolipoamide acyltransferase (E2) component